MPVLKYVTRRRRLVAMPAQLKIGDGLDGEYHG